MPGRQGSSTSSRGDGTTVAIYRNVKEQKMKITEERMRRIIHEEARKILKEMPYAGSIGSVEGPEEGERSFWVSHKSPEELRKGRAAARTLASSQGFKTLATRLYGNFPVPVWTALFAGSLRSSASFSGRSNVVDLDSGIKIMKEIGFSASELAAVDTQKDLVVLYSSETKGKLGTMATPWIIFHAIFDSNAPEIMDLDGYDELLYMFQDKMYNSTMNVKNAFYNTLHNMLTMRAGRHKRLAAITEGANEMIVQQLITAAGLQYNEEHLSTLSEDDQEFFSKSKKLVKIVADSFTRVAPGKLIMVDVDGN
jgi:hypothetical protein